MGFTHLLSAICDNFDKRKESLRMIEIGSYMGESTMMFASWLISFTSLGTYFGNQVIAHFQMALKLVVAQEFMQHLKTSVLMGV